MKRTSFKDSDGKQLGHQQQNILHFNLDLKKRHNGPAKKYCLNKLNRESQFDLIVQFFK